jgi:hypothetical protein
MAPFAPLAGPADDETVGELETELFPPPASTSRRSPPGKASSRTPWTPPAEPDADKPSMPPLLPAGPNALPGKPPAGKAPTSTVQPTGNCLTDGLAEAGLTALLAAVKQAGLSSTFTGLDNVTLLAPTDEAFEAFTPKTGAVPVGLLRTVLYYHVVEGGWRGEWAPWARRRCRPGRCALLHAAASIGRAAEAACVPLPSWARAHQRDMRR